METFMDDLDRLILRHKRQGLIEDEIISALEMALDVAREESAKGN